jgi:GABA(A) receptor-associated protein
MTSYQSKLSFEERIKESSRIRSKYIDRIPIIVEPHSSTDVSLDKNKYLVPSDFTVGQFVYVIRKRINLSPEKSLLMFINNTLPQNSVNISEVYLNHSDKDGFLYFSYTTDMNTFG